jgi:integrase
MAVKKRSRSWEVRIQLGGRQIKRSLGPGSTRKDAIEFEARLIRDHIAGKLGRAPSRTVSEAIERWLDGEAKNHADHQGDEQRARMWLPFVEGRALQDVVQIAAGAVDAWLAAGLAAATINRRLALLRRVARLGHSRWGWLDEDLSRRIVAIPGERQRKVFLSREQVMAMVHAASKTLGDAILLSAYTGLRQGELLRLTPADAADGCVIVRKGKSRASLRTIPVPRQALPILKRLPIKLDKSQLRHAFDALREELGMAHVRWHDIRHTYGSWLAQSGASGPVIRDAMGHSTLQVTSRYLHTAPEHVRAAVRRLK